MGVTTQEPPAQEPEAPEPEQQPGRGKFEFPTAFTVLAAVLLLVSIAAATS